MNLGHKQARGNCSTSESCQSKNTIQPISSQEEKEQKNNIKLLQLNQLQHKQFKHSSTEEENSNTSRLFTFMDEKQNEKRIIQNYVFKNSFKRKNTGVDEFHKKGKSNNGILKIVQDSRKKRQDFLDKLVNHQLTLRENRSISKLNRISRSRTPKHTPYVQNKYQTLQPRSKSKTPKFQQKKVSTPRQEPQVRLFRAKSNLGKEIKIYKKQEKDSQESILSPKGNIFKEDRGKGKQNLNQKQLLKKKRELQKQLLAVNESLLSCKKPEATKKKIKSNKVNHKHSKNKLSKF